MALNDWVLRSNPSNTNLQAVVHDGTRYVTTGAELPASAGIYTLTSLTGKADWIQQTNAVAQGGADHLAFGGGLLGVLQFQPGNNSTFNQSVDGGLTWTEHLTGISLTSAKTDLTRAAGRWIAVGEGISTGITYADDGTLPWIAVPNASPIPIALRAITQNINGSTIIAIGDDTLSFGNGPHIIRSIDKGVTWTVIASNVGGTNHMVSMTYTGTQFVAVGNNGQIMRSADDGLSWTKQFGPILLNLLKVEGQGNFIVATGVDQGGGLGPVIIFSEDGGVVWQIAPRLPIAANLTGIAINGADVVLVGTSNGIQGTIASNSSNVIAGTCSVRTWNNILDNVGDELALDNFKSTGTDKAQTQRFLNITLQSIFNAYPFSWRVEPSPLIVDMVVNQTDYNLSTITNGKRVHDIYGAVLVTGNASTRCLVEKALRHYLAKWANVAQVGAGEPEIYSRLNQYSIKVAPKPSSSTLKVHIFYSEEFCYVIDFTADMTIMLRVQEALELGILYRLYRYLHEDDRASQFFQLYTVALQELITEDKANPNLEFVMENTQARVSTGEPWKNPFSF